MLEKLVSPVAVGVGCRVASQIISLSLVIVASRYLSLADFGIYALAWAATVIAVTFVFSGFYHAVLRSKDRARDIDTLFWMMAAVGATGSAVLLVGGLFVTTGTLSTALIWCAIIPASTTLVAWNEAQMLSEGRTRAASIYTVISEGVGFAISILALEQGMGVMGLVAGRLAGLAVGMTITTGLVRRMPRVKLRTEGLGRAFRTAVPLWVSDGSGMFANYGSDFILGYFLTPAAVGAYRGGARIAVTASDIISQPMGMLNWARFSRLERSGEIDALRNAWRDHAAFAVALSWPILASVALLSPTITLVVLGEKWLPAAPVITLLAVARALALFSLFMTPTLMCMGRGALQMKLRVFEAALLLALLLAAGPSGALAVAAAHIVLNVVMAAAGIWAMATTLKMSWVKMLASVWPGLLLTAGCLTAIVALKPQIAALSAASGLVLTIALLAVIWLTTMAILLGKRFLTLPSP